ncbi:tripartite tricarboxylate transporter substrate binding protein [Pigmentiphaga soli]|uniref:Tripartite tricarboxylate transporter substrate binding protein n=1 Tax=Pigmentiphaga soli TaxID=1007095 RepID=A0ABP8GEY5_9BURK
MKLLPTLRAWLPAPLLCAAALGAVFAGPAAAQSSYPNKPLRMIVPFAPGGAADIVGRAVADALLHELGQPVVVVNQGGAGTIIGVDMAAKAPPDGYTLLVSGDAATVNTASGRKLPYDLMKDLQPVSLLYSGTQYLLSRVDGPYKTLDDLVRYGRAHPGELKFGSTGIGTSTHMSLESFNAAAGIRAVHVPYRGVAPAMTDLAGGHVDYVIAGSTAAIPAIENKTFRALAVTSRTRSPLTPQVRTLIEQGVQAETGSWYGLFVPAGTPPAIVERLNKATVAALKTDELARRFKSLGGETRATTPAEASAFMRDEIDRFGSLMRKLDIKLTE